MIEEKRGRPRIAVVGAGLIGRKHIALFAEEAELAAIADPDPSAADLARRYDVPRHVGVADLLQMSDLDGVVIATPNALHLEHGLACIRAGVPVLIEKPLAPTLTDARLLAEAADAASVPVLVGHHRRHNPLIARAKEVIVSGALGDIVSANAMCWLGKPDRYFDAQWRKGAGGGPLAINLVHDVDLMLHLCGAIESVQALTSNRARGFDVEDTAAVAVRFANGALGTMTVSDAIVAPWSWETTSSENPEFPSHDEPCHRIGGTRASLSLPDLRVWHQDGARDWLKPVLPRQLEVARGDPLRLQARHFLEVAVGDARPRVSAREGVQVLEVIEAIRQSAAAGAVIRIVDLA